MSQGKVEPISDSTSEDGGVAKVGEIAEALIVALDNSTFKVMYRG